MSKQSVAEYVMHTVENTNPAMLNGLLDQLVVESGEDAVEAATPLLKPLQFLLLYQVLKPLLLLLPLILRKLKLMLLLATLL